MAMFAGNNDSLRDRDLLGARVNPSDEYEPEPEVDPSALPDWLNLEGEFDEPEYDEQE